MPSHPHPCSPPVLKTNRPHNLLLTPTLAAAETDAERTQRHLALCRALQDHGMELVRAAAARMHAELAGPPETYKLHILAVTRLSRAVRQAILLEQRVVGGLKIRPTPAPPTSTETQPAEPKPQPPHPAQPGAAPQRADRLAATFDSLPDAEIPTLLVAIGDELGVTLEPHPSPAPAPPATPAPRPQPEPARPQTQASAPPPEPHAKLNTLIALTRRPPPFGRAPATAAPAPPWAPHPKTPALQNTS